MILPSGKHIVIAFFRNGSVFTCAKYNSYFSRLKQLNAAFDSNVEFNSVRLQYSQSPLGQAVPKCQQRHLGLHSTRSIFIISLKHVSQYATDFPSFHPGVSSSFSNTEHLMQ